MQQKRIRIKDIAKLADVSAGTVDRVVHNRGNVSAKSREAVEKVLKEVNYRPNIHMSSISLKKMYHILFVSPKFSAGDYWDSIYTGILRTLDEFENIRLSFKKITYNQYDVYDCKRIYDKVLNKCNAVIIGSIFQKETQDFCHQLDERNFYVFVDSNVENTSPVACFSSTTILAAILWVKL